MKVNPRKGVELLCDRIKNKRKNENNREHPLGCRYSQ